MTQLLLDTNVVSILFKPKNSLYPKCLELVSGHQLFISFMTKAELLLWPALNNWGAARRLELQKHIEPLTTLFADDLTCDLWCHVTLLRKAAAWGGRSHRETPGPPQPANGLCRSSVPISEITSTLTTS